MTFNVMTTRPQVLVDEKALQQIQADLGKRQKDLERLRIAMEVLAAVNETERFAAAAMALVNELASRWKADRVSLGFLKGRYVRLAALSHTEKFTRKMRLVQDIEAAMEECLDQDVEVIYPPAEGATFVSRATEALSSHHGPMSICSFPLRRAGEVVGVLTLERRQDQPIVLEEIEVMRLTCDLATSRMIDLHRNDRWFGAKFATATRRGLGWLVGSKHTWAKVIAILVLALIIFSVVGKGTHKVESPFTLEASEKNVVPAPFEGYLKTVALNVNGDTPEKRKLPLAPGDTVVKDQVLATLDDAELRAKLAAAKADRESYLRQADISRRDGKLAEQQMNEAQAAKSQAEMDELKLKIDEAQIRAPVDGAIFAGDLKTRLGAPVKTGDVLFEIGQRDKLRAQLSVPEDEVARLKLEQKGQLATAAYPDQRIPFVVTRIDPVAEVVNQKNVFKVEATFDAKDTKDKTWMRPGMEGVAKVEVGQARYFWIYTHRLWDFLRMKLWI
jgi:multidrug efflux pump subunit AcrA (membrane-fusion protein)